LAVSFRWQPETAGVVGGHHLVRRGLRAVRCPNHCVVGRSTEVDVGSLMRMPLPSRRELDERLKSLELERLELKDRLNKLEQEVLEVKQEMQRASLNKNLEK
jgi:predicted nuclease with TOPRIM domain